MITVSLTYYNLERWGLTAIIIVCRLVEDYIVVHTTTAAAKVDSTFIYYKVKLIWDPKIEQMIS